MVTWWMDKSLVLEYFSRLVDCRGKQETMWRKLKIHLGDSTIWKSMKIMCGFQLSFLGLRTWRNMASWEFHEVYPSLDVMEIPRYPNKIPSKWEDHVLNFHGDIHQAPRYLSSLMNVICQISKLYMKVLLWRYLHFPCKGMQNFGLINCRKVSILQISFKCFMSYRKLVMWKNKALTIQKILTNSQNKLYNTLCLSMKETL